jgi:hypothetical protein
VWLKLETQHWQVESERTHLTRAFVFVCFRALSECIEFLPANASIVARVHFAKTKIDINKCGLLQDRKKIFMAPAELKIADKIAGAYTIF